MSRAHRRAAMRPVADLAAAMTSSSTRTPGARTAAAAARLTRKLVLRRLKTESLRAALFGWHVAVGWERGKYSWLQNPLHCVDLPTVGIIMSTTPSESTLFDEASRRELNQFEQAELLTRLVKVRIRTSQNKDSTLR